MTPPIVKPLRRLLSRWLDTTHYEAVQPSPPGLPTLRAFQDAQGSVAREWIAQRTGLS